MRRSGFDVRVEVKGAFIGSQSVAGLATGYNGTRNQFFVASPEMFGAQGAGGMYSTVDDLFHYDRALNHGTILPRAIVDSMETRVYYIRPGAGYAYGWIVNDPPGAPRLVHHSGGYNGYTTEYARYPDQHLCIIILSNRGFADPEGMRKRIADVLFGGAKAR
jgi:CubicO group peptidase (beta-lactamase class C family)